MEVQYIILLCLIMVSQTSAKNNVDKMAARVREKCEYWMDKSTCKKLSKTYEADTKAGLKCNNGPYAYEDTIVTIPPTYASGRTMLLWSGCGMNNKAVEIKKRNSSYITVDETTMGRIFTDLRWKKMDDSKKSDIYYKESAVSGYWPDDQCSAPFEYVFWALLSREFASQSKGVVVVILSAKTDGGAFDSTSIFGRYEAKYLDSDWTSVVRVYLYDIGCSNCKKEKSIQELQDIVEAKNIKFECTSKSQPPADYDKAIALSSYSARYDGTKCGGCVMKLSRLILVVVSVVHLFIK